MFTVRSSDRLLLAGLLIYGFCNILGIAFAIDLSRAFNSFWILPLVLFSFPAPLCVLIGVIRYQMLHVPRPFTWRGLTLFALGVVLAGWMSLQQLYGALTAGG